MNATRTGLAHEGGLHIGVSELIKVASRLSESVGRGHYPCKALSQVGIPETEFDIYSTEYLGLHTGQ